MKMVRIPMESLIEVILLQLETAKHANLAVTGCSMLPMLRQYKDTVQLKPIEGTLKPGEIALYQRHNGKYVLHRVIRVTETGYLFCGDNQADLEPVEQEQLIAQVTSFTKNGKRHYINEPAYRLYRFAWVKFFNLRKYYIWLRRRIGRVRNWMCNRRKSNG